MTTVEIDHYQMDGNGTKTLSLTIDGESAHYVEGKARELVPDGHDVSDVRVDPG